MATPDIKVDVAEIVSLEGSLTLASGAKIDSNGLDGELIPQTGLGPPSHSASAGTPYFDTTNRASYRNSNGATVWKLTSSIGSEMEWRYAGSRFVLDDTTQPNADVYPYLPPNSAQFWQPGLLIVPRAAAQNVKVYFEWNVPADFGGWATTAIKVQHNITTGNQLEIKTYDTDFVPDDTTVTSITGETETSILSGVLGGTYAVRNPMYLELTYTGDVGDRCAIIGVEFRGSLV